jgi:hypothetical protein
MHGPLNVKFVIKLSAVVNVLDWDIVWLILVLVIYVL